MKMVGMQKVPETSMLAIQISGEGRYLKKLFCPSSVKDRARTVFCMVEGLRLCLGKWSSTWKMQKSARSIYVDVVYSGFLKPFPGICSI